MADRVICMMLGSPLTECSVHLFKQSIQSCTLPSARKPVYRALCIVSLKHSAEYSVWSIKSAYYNLVVLDCMLNFQSAVLTSILSVLGVNQHHHILLLHYTIQRRYEE